MVTRTHDAGSASLDEVNRMNHARVSRQAPFASSLAALVLAALLLLPTACGRTSPSAPRGGGAARADAHALSSGASCEGTGVHTKHVNLFPCASCHPTGASFGFDQPFAFPGGTTSAGGTIVPKTETTPTTCTVACHFPMGAPAKSVAWNTPGPLDCSACHAPAAMPEGHPPVPPNATEADCRVCHPASGGHMDGTVALVAHGAPWSDPASPEFHAFAANVGLEGCKACHGQDLSGGAADSCASCHDGTVAKPWGACTMCHGGTDGQTGAPPVATWGNQGDAVRIGAHTKHVTASAIAPAAECAACHPNPSDVFASGHLDGGTAEVVFGRAVPGRTQVWDRAAATCSNTYCHAGVAGGGKPLPVWTSAGQGEGACGACHGLPPPSPHPIVSAELAGCAGCHSLTIASTGVIIAPSEDGKHLNGSVEATGGHPAAFKDPASPEFHAYAANRGLASCQGCHGAALDGVGGSTTVACTTCHGAGFTNRCTACHGGVANATGAPPKATWGGASDPLRVGAHTKHVTGGAIGAPIACGVCHVVPTDAFAPGHLGNPYAEVEFTGIAASSGAAPAWDRATGSCSTTYCHGTFSGVYEYTFWEEPKQFPYTRLGGTPAWTGDPLTCTACHANPPTDGPWHAGHDGGCNTCHPDVDSAGTAIVDRTKHVNGVIDIQWNPAAGGVNCGWCH